VSVRLATRGPFAAAQLFEFLGARAVPGVEAWDGERYARTLDLPRGHGVVVAEPTEGGVSAAFELTDWRDLAPAVGRVRRLFDLDADPIAVDQALSADRALAPLVERTPGLRAAGSVDPAETLVRAIVGQQVSVSGARTVLGRIATAVGEPLLLAHPGLTRLFPSMSRLAEAGTDVFPMPAARRATLHAVANLIAEGGLTLDVGGDRRDVVDQLVSVRGIGPWTAEYVVMRGLGDPDVFLDTDLGVRHALTALGLTTSDAEHWRPWRTYAMHHLWASS
jgi:AraC family transcriptional regulator of adaptative response / DNA-3-methyladenine glycosylase II